MLQSLDPYSAYENARQSEDLTMRTVGRYGGVGLTIGNDKEDVVVLGAPCMMHRTVHVHRA